MSVFEMSESFLKAGARCQAFHREAQFGDRSTLTLQDTYGSLRMNKWLSEEIVE